jgi:hypothetical protein
MQNQTACSDQYGELAPAYAGIASWQVGGGGRSFIPLWIGEAGGRLTRQRNHVQLAICASYKAGSLFPQARTIQTALFATGLP